MSTDKPDAAQASRTSTQSFFFQSDIFAAGRLIARRARPGGVVHEAARSIPVFRDCDVLVVGGGPSGTAAAIAAARTGADVVLLERYNHLGGLSTGGLVIWIDRMTDWTGAAGDPRHRQRPARPAAEGRRRRPAARRLGQRRRGDRRLLARAHRRLPRHRHLVADDRPRAAEAGLARSWCWSAACSWCCTPGARRRSCEDGARRRRGLREQGRPAGDPRHA